MVRTYWPELIRGRSETETLELRREANLAREITTRLIERNAAMLRRRSLPVTPATVYLAHFAGGAVPSRSFPHRKMLTLPQLWRLPMQRAGPSAMI